MQILDPDPGLEHFFKNLLNFINKVELSNSFFSHIFVLKLDEPFRDQEKFIISLFTTDHIRVLRLNFFFLQF